MKRIAISQRVEVIAEYNERRDALDQRWSKLFEATGLTPLPIPNTLSAPEDWLKSQQIDGVLLSGGNSLEEYGGNAPERDQLEKFLIQWALENNKPLLGVCRGMQMIQHYFGIRLQAVNGHVTDSQTISYRGQSVEVNSYHDWGSSESNELLEITGVAEDGVIKAIDHVTQPVSGIMWHPERHTPFRNEDIAMLRKLFGIDS